MKTIKRISMLSCAMMLALASCQKDSVEPDIVFGDNISARGAKIKTFTGPGIPFAGGVLKAFSMEDENGNLISVGVDLSARILDNLPIDPVQLVVTFPNHGANTTYTHMLIDWNPQGHEPPGVYDTPHFDFHFYTIPNAQRMSIGPNDVAQFANAPALMYQPPVYLHTPGGVPQMGAHWIDLLAPEFNGGVFTKTFIYGSYDGEFIFHEPMITLAHLRTNPDETIPIRQPSAYAESGTYPGSYSIRYSTNPNKYTIALTDMSWFQGQ